MTPDPHLLERLLCEVALMRHHVAYGVPPPAPPPERVCRNGHTIASVWEEKPDGSCLHCARIAKHRSLRRLAHLTAA